MADLSIEALVERLRAKQPVPAIVLLGADAYLRETAREQVIEVAVDPTARDWGVARFSAADDEFDRGLGQARTVPMLAPRQVVIVTELEALEKLGEKARDEAIDNLIAYVDDPSPFTVLLLEAEHLDQRMRLAKTLSSKAVIVSAEMPQDPNERTRIAAALAIRMAQERASQLDRDAANELADLCNGNLSSIRSEIEKLATYAGEQQPIRLEHVSALVVSEKKYSVWQLADVLATRDTSHALTFLDCLLREGEQPPALVGAMAWMFRKLIEAQGLGSRVSEYQAAGQLGMRVDKARIALQQARRIPRRQLVDGMKALYDADSQLKSGANDRAVMEFLVVRLTANGPEPRT